MPTILVADDNSNIQKMVTLAFKGEGIDVVAVGNGEAAVKKAIEIVPDLVLADIFMPVRSGYEVCEFLKQDSRFSHVPVVLLAGAFDPFDEREAQRVGADGVLKKPFVPPDPLITLVKGLLAKNSERLVAVTVPAQTTAVSVQSSPATPEASASSAPAFTPPPFVPPPFPSPAPDASVKEDEYPEDVEFGTTAPPMRDFSIPAVPPESGHHGGADAFGSMLDTSPLGTSTPLPIRKLGEPETKEEAGEDREIQPASAHTAFEGFSPWRASASSAGVVQEEEAPQDTTDPANHFMPSSKDLMGRVWEVDPSLADKSPDETVIEPLDDLSPLTGSAQHVTTVRQKPSAAVEAPSAPEANNVAEHSETAESNDFSQLESNQSSGLSDWRSALTKAPEPQAQTADSPAASLSPWRMFAPPEEAVPNIPAEEAASAPQTESSAETVTSSESKPVAETPAFETPSSFGTHLATNEEVTDSDATFETKASGDDTSHFVDHAEPEATEAELQTEATAIDEHPAAPDAIEPQAPSSNVETSDWIAALPAHLSPEDTTTIARSVIEQLAPGAVASVATSFPVPTGTATDPRVVEDIVARVVERMQPQILEIITREVLRPVVEALVRRQLEQKSPE